MKPFSNCGVGERGRRLRRQLVALRCQHGQGARVAQAGSILKQGQKKSVSLEQLEISGRARSFSQKQEEAVVGGGVSARAEGSNEPPDKQISPSETD